MRTLKELLVYNENNKIKTPYIGIILFLSLVVSIHFLPQILDERKCMSPIGDKESFSFKIAQKSYEFCIRK